MGSPATEAPNEMYMEAPRARTRVTAAAPIKQRSSKQELVSL